MSSFTGDLGGQIQENYIIPDDKDQAFIRLRQYLNDIAYSLNRKDSGLMIPTPTLTGQQFVPIFGTGKSSNVEYRPVLRVVVDFGALPNATTKSVAHNIPGISSSYSATKIYGAATDPSGPTWIPLPYPSLTLLNVIEITVDSTNVNLTTGIDYTAFTRSFVVVEYIQTT